MPSTTPATHNGKAPAKPDTAPPARTWQDDRRDMRREVVEFFTRNPDRRTLTVAKGSLFLLIAKRDHYDAERVQWRRYYCPPSVAEACLSDPGEVFSRAFSVCAHRFDRVHGDDGYTEHLWLDGAGGFELSCLEIGGKII